MIIYYRGVAIRPSVARVGRSFAARASILEEDGHPTSLGMLGMFANESSAFHFAVRCASAFVDGDDMPLPPFQVVS
ncbi:hypothetical protein [Caballeronia glebae]|jgi:hypothetical protein|uniref:hypothetical protein n=1 Tax=Caballeronia glebae TaxID=1777143 RepID=UPI0038B81509